MDLRRVLVNSPYYHPEQVKVSINNVWFVCCFFYWKFHTYSKNLMGIMHVQQINFKQRCLVFRQFTLLIALY